MFQSDLSKMKKLSSRRTTYAKIESDDDDDVTIQRVNPFPVIAGPYNQERMIEDPIKDFKARRYLCLETNDGSEPCASPLCDAEVEGKFFTEAVRRNLKRMENSFDKKYNIPSTGKLFVGFLLCFVAFLVWSLSVFVSFLIPLEQNEENFLEFWGSLDTKHKIVAIFSGTNIITMMITKIVVSVVLLFAFLLCDSELKKYSWTWRWPSMTSRFFKIFVLLFCLLNFLPLTYGEVEQGEIFVSDPTGTDYQYNCRYQDGRICDYTCGASRCYGDIEFCNKYGCMQSTNFEDYLKNVECKCTTTKGRRIKTRLENGRILSDQDLEDRNKALILAQLPFNKTPQTGKNPLNPILKYESEKGIFWFTNLEKGDLIEASCGRFSVDHISPGNKDDLYIPVSVRMNGIKCYLCTRRTAHEPVCQDYIIPPEDECKFVHCYVCSDYLIKWRCRSWWEIITIILITSFLGGLAICWLLVVIKVLSLIYWCTRMMSWGARKVSSILPFYITKKSQKTKSEVEETNILIDRLETDSTTNSRYKKIKTQIYEPKSPGVNAFLYPMTVLCCACVFLPVSSACSMTKSIVPTIGSELLWLDYRVGDKICIDILDGAANLVDYEIITLNNIITQRPLELLYMTSEWELLENSAYECWNQGKCLKTCPERSVTKKLLDKEYKSRKNATFTHEYCTDLSAIPGKCFVVNDACHYMGYEIWRKGIIYSVNDISKITKRGASLNINDERIPLSENEIWKMESGDLRITKISPEAETLREKEKLVESINFHGLCPAADKAEVSQGKIGELQFKLEGNTTKAFFDKTTVKCVRVPVIAVSCQRDPPSIPKMLKECSTFPIKRGATTVLRTKSGVLELSKKGTINLMYSPSKNYKIRKSPKVCVELVAGSASGCSNCVAGVNLEFRARSTCEAGLVKVLVTPDVIVDDPYIFLKNEWSNFNISIYTTAVANDWVVSINNVSVKTSVLAPAKYDVVTIVDEDGIPTEAPSRGFFGKLVGIFSGIWKALTGFFSSIMGKVILAVLPVLICVLVIVVGVNIVIKKVTKTD